MKNIVLIGMMGCGKTTIGKLLAEELSYEFIDCDEYLENRFNTKISNCFLISEEYFRNLESQCTEELSKHTKKVISTGGGIVTREKNIEYLKDDIVFFINRPIELIVDSIDKEDRPLIKNKNKSTIIDIYNSRLDLYKKYCDFEIINDSSIEYVINEIKKLI